MGIHIEKYSSIRGKLPFLCSAYLLLSPKSECSWVLFYLREAEWGTFNVGEVYTGKETLKKRIAIHLSKIYCDIGD